MGDVSDYIEWAAGWNEHHDPADMYYDADNGSYEKRGNHAERKYKVNVTERGGQRRVVYAENGTSRAGAFFVDRNGVYTWLTDETQRMLVKQLMSGSMSEPQPGQAYRTAYGIINNALAHRPEKAIQITPTGRTPRAPEYQQITITKPQGAKTMTNNAQEAITLMQLTSGAKVVAATYPSGGGVYHFKNVIGAELAKDDMIVVETRGELSLATVVDPDVDVTAVTCGYEKLVHVVQKVDMAGLKAIKTAEGKARHQLAMSEVHDRLDKFRSQIGSSAFAQAQSLLGGGRHDDGVVDHE